MSGAGEGVHRGLRVLLMGPPGAGKGTQAERLAAALAVPAISTGDIFRANVSALTPLGLEARRYLDAGDYVPDHVTNSMVRNRLSDDDAAGGWILDGYPRTAAQVDELDTICDLTSDTLDLVLVLDADEEELVVRLLKRAQADGRSDDTEPVIRHRQDVYREQTQALTALYDRRGLVRVVDGRGEVGDVTRRCLAAVSTVREAGSATANRG